MNVAEKNTIPSCGMATLGRWSVRFGLFSASSTIGSCHGYQTEVTMTEKRGKRERNNSPSIQVHF